MKHNHANGICDHKQRTGYTRTNWGWGHAADVVGEVRASRSFPWKLVYALVLLLPGFLVFSFSTFNFWSFLLFLVVGAVLALPIIAGTLVVHSRLCVPRIPPKQDVIVWKDKAFASTYKGKKIPMLELYEAYFSDKIDFNGDLLHDVIYKRYELANFVLQPEHFRFFIFQLIPELLVHSRNQDMTQVREHYDRGDDFYHAFLGDTMMYTSGVFLTENDDLETAQKNKLDLVFNKIHAKKGDRHLDIGCGWGTTLLHAAKNFGTESTGVTLSQNQCKWANDQLARHNLGHQARAKCMDYRDIPPGKYDIVTSLEMAEHVGVRLFQSYLRQIYDLLTDDGMFFMQIAGLRRPWQYEDLVWGLFMGKYIFPGADASCPLSFVIEQAEAAGFEIHTVETIGVHYSATIKRWLDNWMQPDNKAIVVKAYGEHWWRKWAWFLSWSSAISEQGSATCYQLVMHKNLRTFDRKNVFIGERAQYHI